MERLNRCFDHILATKRLVQNPNYRLVGLETSFQAHFHRCLIPKNGLGRERRRRELWPSNRLTGIDRSLYRTWLNGYRETGGRRMFVWKRAFRRTCEQLWF